METKKNSFATEEGNKITLNVLRGYYGGKIKFWECELLVKGIELTRNYATSYGAEGYEEMRMCLSGENPVCYCKKADGKDVMVQIPAEVAKSVAAFIHFEN